MDLAVVVNLQIPSQEYGALSVIATALRVYKKFFDSFCCS